MTYDEDVATLPHLDPEEQLNLLEVLSSVLKKRIAPQKAKKHSLLELEELGEGIWSKVDVESTSGGSATHGTSRAFPQTY